MAITEGVESAIGNTNVSGRNKRRRIHIERNREQMDADLLGDYLQDCATYTDKHFKRRFGVRRYSFEFVRQQKRMTVLFDSSRGATVACSAAKTVNALQSNPNWIAPLDLGRVPAFENWITADS
jgi:hypothetical protein